MTDEDVDRDTTVRALQCHTQTPGWARHSGPLGSVYASNDNVLLKPFLLRVGHRQPPSLVARTLKNSNF